MAYATLIKDGQRVPAQDKAEADKLFAQGYELEKQAPQGAPEGQPQQKTYVDYITEALKTPEYESSQKQYDEALAKLTELQEQVPGYLDRESQRLETADPALQQLLSQQAEQTGQLHSQPFTARNRFKNIFDPRQRSALVAKSVGNVISQLAGTKGLIGQQRGFAGQRAQTSLDALLAQSGLAETALGAAGEKKDFLKDLLTQGAAAEYDKQYTPISEEEWGDIEKKLQLTKAYSNSGGPNTPGLTPGQTADMRLDLRDDLGVMQDAINNRQLTREQVIEGLTPLYPEIEGEIGGIVYALFPDTSLSPELQPSQSGPGALSPLESGISPWDVLKEVPGTIKDTKGINISGGALDWLTRKR